MLARDCIRNKRDFTVETTLAGGNIIRQMREARENGFEVIMFYVGLGDYRLNIERVAARVRNGGHHIPTEDIIRRHQTSMENLLTHIELINYLIVIDNSNSDGEIVLETDCYTIIHRAALMPQWVKPIQNQLQNKMDIHD